MPVTSDIVRLKAYRAANPDLANLSDQEFASIVFEQTGELGDYVNAGPLQRGIGEYSAFMQGLGEQAGKKVERGLRRYGFKPDDVGVTATTKAVKGLVSSAPETIAALGAAALFPRSRTIAGLATAGLTGSQAARTYADTGSKQSALSAGVSGVGQLAGGLAGAKVAGKLGGGALAKAGGSLLGSTVGDVAGMTVDPQQLKENFGTKSDALAYGLTQLPFAALDVAHGLGESANAKREAKVASTELPGQLDLVTLQKIPVASLSDDQAARLVALSKEAASKEEANAAKVSMESMKPEDFMPESDVTLNEQAKLVKEGRKPLLALSRDLDAKRVPELEGLNSVEVGDQKLYFPPEVDANKVVSDYNAGVGKALGYGTNDPSTSGFALVLRGENGVEKLAVNVNPKNINDVATALRNMAGPGDMVFKEPIVSLHESRKLAGNKAVETAPQTLLDLNKVGETPFAIEGEASIAGKDFLRDRVFATVPEPESKIKGINVDSKGAPLYRATELAGHIANHVGDDLGGKFLRMFKEQKVTKDYAANWIRAQQLKSQLGQVKTQLERSVASGVQVTPADFVRAIDAGEKVDKAILLRFLRDLNGDKSFRLFNLQPTGELQIRGVTTSEGVFVNKAQNAKSAFAAASYEFNHVAFHELKQANPHLYQQAVEYASGLGSDGRAALLKSVFDTVGVKGFDFDYASGRKFDPQAEDFNEASAREFYAGLTEALAHDAFNTASRTNSKLNELFRALPQGVQDVLSRLLEKLRQYFSPNSGLRNSLPADVASELDRAYQKLLTFYGENKLAQQSAARQLERLGVFTYGEGLPDLALAKQQAASVEKIATQYSLSELPGVKSVVELYDKYLFNPQYNAFVHPELQDGWLELHTTKSKERAVIYSYMEFLGQDGSQTLSREQAVVRTEKLIRQLTSKPEIATKVSSVLEENTARRLSKQEKSSEVVTQRDLVSVQEMKEKFGLSDEMAEFTQRLSQVTAKAAEQTLRFMQANDNVSLAKLVYSQLSSTHSIKQVKEGCTGLTRIGSDLGQKLFEKELLTSALTSARESTSGAQRSAELTARLQKSQVEASFLETQFNLKVDEVFGQDSFKPKFKKLLLDTATSLGRNRAEHQFTTKDAGYMPMTRRGRFLLWVYDGPANSAASSTKELKGFNTAEEARKYIEDKKIVHYDLKDKQDFERRAEFYNTPQLQRFADKTRKELAAIVEEYKKTAIGVDGLGNVGKILDDLVENFRPVDEELKQLVSVKGDKFAQRRWYTPGFDKKDYLPNLFEYLQYKTHQAQRRLTTNEYQLQMLQPAIQSNPEKLKYMGDELKYFTTPQAEWGKVREGIFYYYLGLSPRQFFLNSTQLFLNAIPAAVKMGHGINAYPDTIKALALVAQHTATGTTGNKVFDGLLKQAELDGVIMPNALENFVPELDEVQSSLDNISTWVDGESKLGYEAKQVAGDMSRGLRTALRSLGVAGEKINRRTSFLMSLLQSERAGVKDAKEMYRKASLFTDHVNFVGDKSNRVGLIKAMQGNQAHGAILTVTAMQSFSLNHASQLAAYAKTLKTSRDKAALGVAMLHLGLMAGTLGLPFVRNGLALIGSVTDEDPEQYLRRKGIETASKYFNVSEQAGGTITSLAMDGLPSALGIDAGSSLGLGDMLFRFQADRVPTLFDLAGPGGGIVSNLGKAVGAIGNDPSDVSSYVNAIRTGGPTGAKYIARLTDMAFDNKYYNGAGDVKLDDLNKVDTASILLGFTPARATAMQKQSVSVMKAGQAYSSKRSAVVTKIAQRLVEYDRTGDQTKATEAKELLNNFLEENPFVNASELISSISDAKTKKSTVVLGAPSANVYKQFEATRSAYPGTEYPVSNQTQSLSDEIRVALSVGRLDVLAQKLSALPKQSQKAGLYDSLVQAGYNPALVQRALSGDTKALELLLRPGE